MNESDPKLRSAHSIAHSNIALAKYWGKRNSELNIPAVSSISITLEALATKSSVTFDPHSRGDSLEIDGERFDTEKISVVLDLVRTQSKITDAARIQSSNNFPTSAGLASSASGIAALTIAAASAVGLALSRKELSMIARRGSASAARSIFGGFVELHSGSQPDGSDSFAEPILDREDWPLEVVVAITQSGKKATSSTTGMLSTAGTSPFFDTWVSSAPAKLAEMREAILALDFQHVGELTEQSCLAMHSLMFTTVPSLIYWNEGTISVIREVQRLRASGTECYFTIDAGPQVKIICEPANSASIVSTISELPAVVEVRRSRLGPDAQLVNPK